MSDSNSDIMFSVIVPTYNRAEFIVNVINAFKAQIFQNFELIVVDDGSTDGTEQLFANIDDTRIRYYKKENEERGAARNFGAAKAVGKYLNFFDSDDLPYNNHLSNAYEFLMENGFPSIFNVGYRVVNADGSVLCEETNFNYNLNARLINTNFFACNSIFVDKDIFLHNKFNESRELASAEDWELWLRLSSRFVILSSDKITFQMNNHFSRSLYVIEAYKVEQRDRLLIEALLKDEPFVTVYKKNIPRFISDRYTFIALTYAMEKENRMKSIRYLIKSFLADPMVLKRKRFYASIKCLF